MEIEEQWFAVGLPRIAEAIPLVDVQLVFLVAPGRYRNGYGLLPR